MTRRERINKSVWDHEVEMKTKRMNDDRNHHELIICISCQREEDVPLVEGGRC